jgi:phage tail protein X
VIYLGSRYEDSDVTYVRDPKSRETRPTVLRATQTRYASQLYRWRSGDRIDILAYNIYGSTADWWKILDANPAIIDPNSIRPGTVLRIP